ncbi:MAG: adenosylcobinamide-GDP ribazoletransferase [Actinobacteria bacterium]|nr:adenosylcobinamide-GDP ribazoletransferase [Actinomycetota bacterium]
MIIGIGIVLLILKYCQKRMGGISGDILGEIIEIVEVSILLAIYLLNHFFLFPYFYNHYLRNQ